MKISVYIALSVDGFIARPDGTLDWLPGADGEAVGDEDYGYHDFFDSVDVLVMGRKTFEMVLGFGEWPYAGKRVVVVSTTLDGSSPTLPEGVSTHPGPPHALARELEASGARHLYVDGGRTIQSFLHEGLVQELILTRIPILIGEGIPLFGPLDEDVPLTHLSTRAFDSGMVQSHYAVG